MNWTSGLSTLAAILTFATFYMHGEQKIRAVAMAANGSTMAYTAVTYMAGTHSIAAFFFLHTTLLIMNGCRLRKLRHKESSVTSPPFTPPLERKHPRPASPSGLHMHLRTHP